MEFAGLIRSLLSFVFPLKPLSPRSPRISVGITERLAILSVLPVSR
jgi:hypothetical protein